MLSKSRQRLKLLVIALALGLLYSKTIAWLVGSWIYNSYYSHGLIVLAVSMYFAYRTCRKESISPEVDVRGLYLVSAATIIHVFATLWDVEYVSAVSLLFAVFGIILTLYGSKTARKLVFPVFFMILAVPFPIYNIANWLEVLSAQTSVNFVNAFGVEASNTGAEIHLKACSFVVGAPCSGIRSIISLLTVATLYVYLIQDKMPVKVALVALSIPFAFFANVLRISSILVVAELYGRNAALGFFHYASDIVLFVTAVVMLMFLRRCLKWLTSRPHF